MKLKVHETMALIEAAEPFARVARVIDALPREMPLSADTPLRDVMLGVWPTLGDVRKLHTCMIALGWKPR
jgi:hypothetical protein